MASAAARTAAMVAKLHHDLADVSCPPPSAPHPTVRVSHPAPPPLQVRERAVSNLHSKIVSSSLVAVADLSPADLTGALLHAYAQRTLPPPRQVQMLELLLAVARDHPQGTVMLRER